MKKKIIYKGKKPFAGRVYREQDGNYMSVTSIIHPDGLDYPPELLNQYASRGLIVHKQVEHYILTEEVISPEETKLFTDISTMREGSLKLDTESCNYVGFFDEFGDDFDIRYVEQKLKNRKYKYAGRADMIGKYQGEWAIIDIKTSTNYTDEKLISYWMQLSAYANCITPVPTKLVIIPLTPTSDRGYEPPIVETDVKHYFNLFLKQLEKVKEEYQIPTV